MLSSELRDVWELKFGKNPVFISHKNDWNRRASREKEISVAAAHELWAEKVITLARFYASELRGIVTQASFWYMSHNNVINRPITEKNGLVSMLLKQYQPLFDLAKDVWASIVPFGEIDLLTNNERDVFEKLEQETKQFGKEFQIWIAVAYSRTPFLIRTILDLEATQNDFSPLPMQEKILLAYKSMHKWLELPNLYFISWDGDGTRTSDGFYDPNVTHIHSTKVLWPNITCDIMSQAIINVINHQKVKNGT